MKTKPQNHADARRPPTAPPFSLLPSPFSLLSSICAFLLLLLTACAKIGEPRPPLRLVPQHTMELTGIQKGEQVVLTFPAPARNTNGTPVTTLQQIDVYRLMEPRTYQPAEITAEDFERRAQRIQSIPASELSRQTKDGKLTLPDDPAATDRALLFQRSFRYAVTFVNDKKKHDGFSNFVFLSPIPIPEAPVPSLSVPAEEAIEVTWPAPTKNLDGSRPPKVVGYNVFRSESAGAPSGPPLNPAPISDTVYRDPAFEFGKTYYYSISVVGSTESPYAESRPSKPVAYTPVDKFPPKPPKDINLFPDIGEIRLVWAANTEPDLAGYSVYRSETPGAAEPRKLTPTLITATTYRDTDVIAGRRYHYVITATDRNGNRSNYSDEVSDIAK